MYRIRVWDNFHYQDDDEAYWLQEEFETEEEAVARAKQIVYESCKDVGFELAQYTMFGDDPAVFGPPDTPRVKFSGREYAREICLK